MNVNAKIIAMGVAAACAGSIGTAGAASLISSSQIKDQGVLNRDVKKNTLTFNRLSPGTRALILKAGQPGAAGAAGAAGTAGAAGSNGTNGTNGTGSAGAAGAKGDTGAQGTPGAKGDTGAAGSAGAKGDKGDQGTAGTNGKDGAAGAPGTDGTDGTNGTNGTNGAPGAPGAPGANPGVPVGASGDQGFVFSGKNAAGNTASFARGALHVPGGFDGSTAQGAIGLAKPYATKADGSDGPLLSTFSALGYKYVENLKSSTDKATVHVTVVGAVQGVDSKFASGFTNLVYNPVYNGLANTREAIVDGFAGGNAWYSTGAQGQSGSQAQPISIQAFIARNPNARITQIAFDNGGASSNTSASGDTDFSIDNGVVGFGNTFTRYDFGG